MKTEHVVCYPLQAESADYCNRHKGAAEKAEHTGSWFLPDVFTRTARLTCLFGAFVLLQFTVLALANHAGEGFLSQKQRDQVYFVLQVFVILGSEINTVVMAIGSTRMREKISDLSAKPDFNHIQVFKYHRCFTSGLQHPCGE